MLRKKLLIAIAIMLVIVMNISGIYALSTEEIIASSFSTGIVNIELDIYSKDSQNTEDIYNDQNRKVMPGEKISYIPRIKNLGDDCYVRAKVLIEDDDENQELCKVDDLLPGWYKQGDFYYYKSALGKGKKVDIFKNLKIPDNIEVGSDKTILVSIYAEAIQAKNFEPDFSSENPWKNEEIQKCIKSSSYVSDNFLSNVNVVYSKNSLDLETDLFSELDNTMPGDTLEETVKIKNLKKNKTEYFLKISEGKASQKAEELLKLISFQIKDESGNTIFEGTLLDVAFLSLGKFNPGEEKDLTFIIKIPAELKNEYAAVGCNINWEFLSEDEIEPGKGPKTGDTKFDTAMCTFISSSVCLVIVMLLIYREKRKDEE